MATLVAPWAFVTMPFSSVQENMKAPRAESLHHKGHIWVHDIHSQFSSEQLRDAILLMPQEAKVFHKQHQGLLTSIARVRSHDVILSAADVLSLQERYLLGLSSMGIAKSREVELAYTAGDSSSPLTLTHTLHAHYRNGSVSMYSYFTTCWSLRGCCG